MVPDLSQLSTLGLGAGVAALAAGWQQVKNLITRLTGTFMVTLEFTGQLTGNAQIYLRSQFKTSPTAFRFFHGATFFIRPKAKYGTVAHEHLGVRGRVYWRGWRPLWAEYKPNTSEGPDRIIVRYLRGTFDADKLAAGIAAVDVQKQRQSRFAVYRIAGISGKKSLTGNGAEAVSKSPPTDSSMTAGRPVGYNPEDLGEILPASNPLARLALPPVVLETIEDARRWLASKDWYTARQIPWRRGLLLHGKPGTGKSSLTKALAQELNLPVYQMDISSMDNEEFHSAYRVALNNVPSMVLLEDIDAVFHGRENVSCEKGKGLTFDCLLNTLSGVENSDGILLVVTTNNIDKLDSALGVCQGGGVSTRPGRIDRTVELPELTHDGKIHIAKRILEGCHSSWVSYLTAQGTNDTGAQFEERCATVALKLYWSKNPQEAAPIYGVAKEE